ncbi:cell wall hydrolase [Paenibacillus thermotolerans]|uniref:cell wall hydrolase n=1 Tax=Paenibacillus thermotolerans TaxID=3027807 RepID=UPI0023687241|nr:MULTISPECIES: cell wall hydrolase [unclassified Paenibacillus]
MKKLAAALTGIGLFISLVSGSGAASAAGSNSYSINIDGKTSPTSYISQGGSVLVPATFFSKLGATVGWDSQYQAVILSDTQVKLSLPSGTNKAYRLDGTKWMGETLGTVTENKPNGTYVPLRYAAEKLGFQVTYSPNSSSISILTGNNAALPAANAQTMIANPTGKTVQTSNEDMYWLYQLTEAEAGGESHQGKVAVAATILNRAADSDYPSRIKDVIFQTVVVKGVSYVQYSPVLDRNIYKVKPSQDTIKAVNEALNGRDPTRGALTFYNPRKTDNRWVRSRPVSVKIGNHVFAF